MTGHPAIRSHTTPICHLTPWGWRPRSPFFSRGAGRLNHWKGYLLRPWMLERCFRDAQGTLVEEQRSNPWTLNTPQRQMSPAQWVLSQYLYNAWVGPAETCLLRRQMPEARIEPGSAET